MVRNKEARSVGGFFTLNQKHWVIRARRQKVKVVHRPGFFPPLPSPKAVAGLPIFTASLAVANRTKAGHNALAKGIRQGFFAAIGRVKSAGKPKEAGFGAVVLPMRRRFA